MYDFPEVRAATDALWSAIAARLQAAGVAAPARLTRPAGELRAFQFRPDLLFSQTCGYPLVTQLWGKVRVLAVPIYRFPGCGDADLGPATHRSVLIVPRGSAAQTLTDLRGGRLAMNGQDSNSGMNLLRAMIAPHAGGEAFFSTVQITGAHRESLRAVGEGRADLAAIDGVTFGQLQRLHPELTEAVRVIGWTNPSPALPFITARRTPLPVVRALRAALFATLADPALAAVRDALGIDGAVLPVPQLYRPVWAYAQQARALGYPELR